MLASSITMILAAVATQFNLATAAPTELEARQLLTIVEGFAGTACNGTVVLNLNSVSPGLCYTTSAGDINSYRVLTTALFVSTCTATSYASTDCSGTALSLGSANGRCINSPSAGHSIKITCRKGHVQGARNIGWY